MENIKSIVDAMSWLAGVVEINNQEVLSRALKSREEIHRRLLENNKELAQHFYILSLSALNQIKNNL